MAKAASILFSLLFSFSLFAQDAKPVIKVKTAELKIYSATWCGPCKSLHAFLEEAGFHKEIPVTWKNQKFVVKVTTYDVTDLPDEGQSLGKETGAVPEIQFWVNSKKFFVGEGIAPALLNVNAFVSFLTDILDNSTSANGIESFADKMKKKDFSKRAAIFLTSALSEDFVHPLELQSHVYWTHSVKSWGFEKNSVLNLFSGTESGSADAVAKTFSGKKVYLQFKPKEVDGAFNQSNYIQALQLLSKNNPTQLLVAMNGYTNKDGVYLWREGALPWEAFMETLTGLNVPNTVFVFDTPPYAKISWSNRPCVYFSKQMAIPSVYSLLRFEELGGAGALDKDYVSLFLKAATQNHSGVDLDSDGKVSFEEAHWYAVSQMTVQSVAFTPLDVVTDAFYVQAKLPESLSRAQVEQLQAVANPVEKQLLKKILTFSFPKIFLQNKEFSFTEGKISGLYRISPFAQDGQNYVNVQWDTISELLLKSYLKKNASGGSRLRFFSIDESDAKTPERLLVNIQYVTKQGKAEKLSFGQTLTPPADWLKLYSLYRDKNWKPSYAQLLKRLLFKQSLQKVKVSDWQQRAKRAEACGF